MSPRPDPPVFADSIYDDLLTDVEGDPERALRYWAMIKKLVDKKLGVPPAGTSSR